MTIVHEHEVLGQDGFAETRRPLTGARHLPGYTYTSETDGLLGKGDPPSA